MQINISLISAGDCRCAGSRTPKVKADPAKVNKYVKLLKNTGSRFARGDAKYLSKCDPAYREAVKAIVNEQQQIVQPVVVEPTYDVTNVIVDPVVNPSGLIVGFTNTAIVTPAVVTPVQVQQTPIKLTLISADDCVDAGLQPELEIVQQTQPAQSGIMLVSESDCVAPVKKQVAPKPAPVKVKKHKPRMLGPAITTTTERSSKVGRIVVRCPCGGNIVKQWGDRVNSTAACPDCGRMRINEPVPAIQLFDWDRGRC